MATGGEWLVYPIGGGVAMGGEWPVYEVYPIGGGVAIPSCDAYGEWSNGEP